MFIYDPAFVLCNLRVNNEYCTAGGRICKIRGSKREVLLYLSKPSPLRRCSCLYERNPEMTKGPFRPLDRADYYISPSFHILPVDHISTQLPQPFLPGGRASR